MNVLCDTSVLIRALWTWHAEHADCVGWLVAAASGRHQLCISSHFIAETYSVVTRLPTRQRIPAVDAWRVIDRDLLSVAECIDLTSMVYRTIVNDLASRGIGGGVVYDALIAAAADIAQVDYLVTMNVSHFEMVWPQGRGRIVSPKTVSAP